MIAVSFTYLKICSVVLCVSFDWVCIPGAVNILFKSFSPGLAS